MIDIHKYGLKGEKLAVRHLKKSGYKILKTNFATKYGEVDIIALETKRARKKQKDYKIMPKYFKDESVIVFIEVKSRTRSDYGLPSDAVNATKQNRYQAIAHHFLSLTKLAECQIRFDIIEVLDDSVNHIQNAF